MKVVLIGCGLIARSHVEVLKKIDDADLVAVCDINENAVTTLAKECDCNAYTDAEEMLAAEEPDVAVICVPTFVHERYVKLCAENGIDVLCEKPLERSAETCQKLINDVEQAGIIFMTAQVVRFWPGYTLIKEMYEKGEIGDIYMMHLRLVSSRAGQYGQWLFNPELGGGAMHDMLVHDVDFLRHLAGPFKQCYANAVKDETGCYNNVMANIIHKNGAHAVAEVSFTMQTGYPFSFSIHIVGTKATVEYSYCAGATIAERGGTKSEMKVWYEGTGLKNIEIDDYDPYQKQMEYFLDCVRNKKQPEIITTNQSYDVIKMMDALHLSADTGNIINFQ